MQTNRALAAANAIARDFPHMMGEITCVAPLSTWTARNIISGDRLLGGMSGERRSRTLLPSQLGDLTLRQLRETKNKRVLAALTIATELDCPILVEIVSQGSKTEGRLTLVTNLMDQDRHTAASFAAAATYLRITHSEMIRIVTEKAGREESVPSFAVSYADDALTCIMQMSVAIPLLARWVSERIADAEIAAKRAKAAAAKAKSPLGDSMPTILRLRELMEAITPEGLAFADRPLFDEALELVEQLAA